MGSRNMIDCAKACTGRILIIAPTFPLLARGFGREPSLMKNIIDLGSRRAVLTCKKWRESCSRVKDTSSRVLLLPCVYTCGARTAKDALYGTAREYPLFSGRGFTISLVFFSRMMFF